MIEINWNIAPEWAVAHALHVSGAGMIKEVWVGEDRYQQLDHSKSFPYGGGEGDSRHNSRRYQFKYETLRPEPWNGEGLPPVGAVCERRFHDTEGSSWNRVTVTAHGHKKIMCLEESGDEWAHYALEVSFRPARTPEQIAAEQRSADLNQMIGSIKDHPHKYPGVTHLSQLKIQEDACIDLYDAGWRKVTP